MPEYILYDMDGKKHTLIHMVDVRTALDTGLYSAERPKPVTELYSAEKPELDKKKPGRPKTVKESQSNAVEIETKKTPEEKMRDKVKIKSDIEKMEEKVKEKKS